MQYVPSIGEKGILVLLGGSCQSVTQLNNSETPNLVPMDVIDVFDVASLYNTSLPDGVWYRQNATGQNSTASAIPSAWIDFCIIVASAQDDSSHNM